MINNAEFKKLSTQLQKQLLDAMTDIISAQKEWNLPNLPSQFNSAYENLQRTDFYIVVCGEVKKGKSSLINALLGQDVLPTGTSETTSQIFCISNSPEESFALVFDDGSKEFITREGLTRYGSQTAANQKGDPLFDGRNLLWIEVNVPAAFLPPGVHIIDTPGLGAMYPLHAEVTLRQIKKADAAIYLLDSTTPLTDTDTKFIDRILSVTKDIVFVQSRIDENQTADQNGLSNWETINKNHQLNLQEKYGSVLGKIPVYPLSSLWLRKAVEASDDEKRKRVLARCRFDDFTNALERLIYRVAGWNAACIALQAIYLYYPMGKRWLQEQIKALDPSVCRELIASKTELQKNFEAQWGAQGTVRQQLIHSFQEIVRPVREQVLKICSPDGEIARKYQRYAEDMIYNSLDEINDFAESVGPAMEEDVTDEIQSLMIYAYDALQQRLPDMELTLPELDFPAIDLPEPKGIKGSDVFKKIRNASMYATVGAGVAMGIVSLFALPLAPFVLPVAAVAAKKGWDEVKQIDQEKAVAKLQKFIMETLSAIRHSLTSFDVRQGNSRCIVDTWVAQIEQSFKQSLEDTYELQYQRQQQELESIERMHQLESDKFNKKKADLQDQSQQWAKLEQLQQQAAELLKKLEAELNIPQVA